MFPPDVRYYFDDYPQSLRRVEEMIAEYSTEACDTKISPGNERFTLLETRICLCWRNHLLAAEPLNRTPLDIDAVFQSLLDGMKYRTDIRLEGNPIRDLVLAQAMAWGENKAWKIFESEHIKGVQAIAKKRQSNNDFWSEFLAYLGGYDVKTEATEKRPSRLDGYTGISGLKKWIAKTYFRFLNEKIETSRREPSTISENIETLLAVKSSPLSSMEQHEFQGFFTESFQHALGTLPVKYRHLLILLFLFDLTNREAAKIFNVHEGTVSRWKSEAVEMIREQLFDRCEKKFGWKHLSDAAAILTHSNDASASIVHDGLRNLLRQLQQGNGGASHAE